MKTLLILIDQWLSSPNIAGMDPSEEGALLRLMLHAAQSEDCGLPNDDQELAKLSRLDRAWFRKPKHSSKTSGERIRECFFCVDGRLYNSQLLEDRDRWEKATEQKRQAGRASAERRRQQEVDARTTGVGAANEKFDSGALNGTTPAMAPKTDTQTNAEPESYKSENTASTSSDIQKVAWIKEALGDLMEPHRRAGPDDDLCRQVLKGLNGASLDEFRSFLLDLRPQILRQPPRTWGWFVTVTKTHFASRRENVDTASIT